MLGFFKDTPVIGKANTIIQTPSDKLFNFIGNDLLINYPRWSPEVKELEKLTDGPIKLGTLWAFCPEHCVPISCVFRSNGYRRRDTLCSSSTANEV